MTVSRLELLSLYGSCGECGEPRTVAHVAGTGGPMMLMVCSVDMKHDA